MKDKKNTDLTKIDTDTLQDHVMHEKAIRDFVIKIVLPIRPIAS